MILVIDNYDSFVYNLARYINNTGFSTHTVRNDSITIEEIIKLNPTHIVISPGPCTPNEAGISIPVIQNFYKTIPILGVCLGHQAIGQVFGATVTHAKQPMHGKASQITHNGQGIFRFIPNNINVARYHSLIVENICADSDLTITATSHDNKVMAVQHKLYPVFGVQFHPEAILTTHGMDMIRNFVNVLR